MSSSFGILNMWPDGVAPERPTVDRLLEQWRAIKALIPEPTAFDLYPHPDIPQDQVYELNLRKAGLDFMQPKDRRCLVVPKNRLEEIARLLRDSGADVRVRPQYGPRPPDQP